MQTEIELFRGGLIDTFTGIERANGSYKYLLFPDVVQWLNEYKMAYTFTTITKENRRRLISVPVLVFEKEDDAVLFELVWK